MRRRRRVIRSLWKQCCSKEEVTEPFTCDLIGGILKDDTYSGQYILYSIKIMNDAIGFYCLPLQKLLHDKTLILKYLEFACVNFEIFHISDIQDIFHIQGGF